MATLGQKDTFFAGNPRFYDFTIADDDNPGSALNLTGMTARFALSRFTSSNTYSTTAILEKTTASGIVITSAAAGQLRVSLDPADTAALAGDYYFELEIVDASSNPVVVATGTITILKNVVNS